MDTNKQVMFCSLHEHFKNFAPKEYKTLCEQYFEKCDDEAENECQIDYQGDKDDITADIFSSFPKDEFMLFVGRLTGHKFKESSQEKAENDFENSRK